MTGWNGREPGEPLADWMLRLQLSFAAIEASAAGVFPTGQKIPAPVLPRGCGDYHAGECTSEWPYNARGA